MKRFSALFMAMVMVFAFAACKNNEEPNSADISAPSLTESDTTVSTGDGDTDTGADNSTSATESKEGNNTIATSAGSGSKATGKPSPTTKPNTSTNSSSATSNTSKSATNNTSSSGHKHTWSKWEIVEHALVGKAGSEKRTCSGCSASETQKRTANAIANSFYDGGLQYIFLNEDMHGSSLLQYASHELHDYLHKATPSAKIIEALSERFNLTDALKADIISAGIRSGSTYGYNEKADTFTLEYYADISNGGLLGYVHNDGNKYTAYYSYISMAEFGQEAILWKVDLEYNKLNGKPNKYFSIEKVTSLPSNMIKCPDTERSEFDR